VSAEEIRSLLYRYIEGFATGNHAILEETLAPNYVRHAPEEDEDRHSLEEVKQEVIEHKRKYPDLQWFIDDTVVEGNKYACRWHGTATDPATGKKATLWGVNIGHIEGGKIVEVWEGWGKRREGGEIR